jgi:hypothetical protein
MAAGCSPAGWADVVKQFKLLHTAPVARQQRDLVTTSSSSSSSDSSSDDEEVIAPARKHAPCAHRTSQQRQQRHRIMAENKEQEEEKQELLDRVSALEQQLRDKDAKENVLEARIQQLEGRLQQRQQARAPELQDKKGELTQSDKDFLKREIHKWYNSQMGDTIDDTMDKVQQYRDRYYKHNKPLQLFHGRMLQMWNSDLYFKNDLDLRSGRDTDRLDLALLIASVYLFQRLA